MSNPPDPQDDALAVTISYVKTAQRTLRTLLGLLRQLEADLTGENRG